MTITSKQIDTYLQSIASSPHDNDGCIFCQSIQAVEESSVPGLCKEYALDAVMSIISRTPGPNLPTHIFCVVMGFALGYTHAQTEILEGINEK